MKRTKIVATIGPSTADAGKIKKLIESGVNVARINFSHGDHVSNGHLIDLIKKARKKMQMPVGIMADLQGPRIRTVVSEEIPIKKGEEIIFFECGRGEKHFSSQNLKNLKTIGLDWKGIISAVEIGNDILIEDGLLRTRVVKKNKNYLISRVEEGGMIKNSKGVNIPDAKLKFIALTPKDEKDLQFALMKDVDFIALSFVSSAKEITEVKKKIKNIVKNSQNLPQVVAKIERKEAIKNILEIINVADAVMVARGDLGIELEESRVAIYQKEIISRCLRNATPVIVATQMLNSMIENPRPTRAEVSDVSNAVIDHTDAVMLSGETANGKYPIEAVKVMREIIEKTEDSPFDVLDHGFLGDKSHSLSAAVAHAAHELQKDSKAKAIIAASMSGFSARMISRHRPEKPIYVMTNSQKTHNLMSLVWGVESFVLPNCATLDELIDKSAKMLKNKKLIRTNDRIVIVTGRPGVTREHMSLVKVEEVK